MKNYTLLFFAILLAGCSGSTQQVLPLISIDVKTGAPMNELGGRPYYSLEQSAAPIIKTGSPTTVREAEYLLAAAWHVAPANYAHKALDLTSKFNSPVLTYYRAKFTSAGFGVAVDRDNALALMKSAADKGVMRAQLDYVDLLIQDRRQLGGAIEYLANFSDSNNTEVCARILYFKYIVCPSNSLKLELKNIAMAGGLYARYIQGKFFADAGDFQSALETLERINDYNNADLLLTLADLNEAVGNMTDAKIYFYACARKGDLIGLKRLAAIFEKEQDYKESSLLYTLLYGRDANDENKADLIRVSSKFNQAPDDLLNSVKMYSRDFCYSNENLETLLLQRMRLFK